MGLAKSEAAAKASNGRMGGRSIRFKKGVELMGQCENALLKNTMGRVLP